MPRPLTPLTPVDYLKFNEMITRIRTLEHIATQRFFRGNSLYRATITEDIKVKVTEVQKDLPKPGSPGFTDDHLRSLIHPGIAVDASDAASLGHGCSFPYCPSNGICELCGLEEIQQQLLAALEPVND
jgi:hypothetical protein